MLGPLAVVLPLVLAGVLLASAVGKLRHPDDPAGWAELGVPKALRRPWLVRIHPWAELALAVALAVLGGLLGILAAVVAAILMAAYLWLVWRTLLREVDASCACFGERRPVTRVTVIRNAWLTVLALGTASVIGITPLVGGAVAAAVMTAEPGWLLGVTVAVITVLVIRWPEGGTDGTDAVPAASAVVTASDDELDYVRTRTPSVPVTLADGSLVNLQQLTMLRPMLLLSVSATCGGCEPVIEKVPEWRRLLPEVDVRLLLSHAPQDGTLTELTAPQSLHDPHGYVSGSLAEYWSTPTAVLFGVDGLLAGGPEVGYLDIVRFVEDIDATLHPPALDPGAP